MTFFNPFNVLSDHIFASYFAIIRFMSLDNSTLLVCFTSGAWSMVSIFALVFCILDSKAYVFSIDEFLDILESSEDMKYEMAIQCLFCSVKKSMASLIPGLLSIVPDIASSLKKATIFIQYLCA